MAWRVGGPKRFSVQRKMAVVARLLRGEALQVVARETNINIARLIEGRDRALAGVGSHLGRDRKEVGGRLRKDEYPSRNSCWRRFSMKWKVRLERIDEARNLHSTTVGYVERPELTSEADLGLTHDDGKYLIRRIQAEVAEDQVRALTRKFGPVWPVAVSVPSKNIGAGGSTRCLDICASTRLASRPTFADVPPPRLPWPSSFRIALRRN